MYRLVWFVVTAVLTHYSIQLPWNPLLSRYNGEVEAVLMNEPITIEDWERAIAQLDPVAESFFLAVSPLHVCYHFIAC